MQIYLCFSQKSILMEQLLKRKKTRLKKTGQPTQAENILPAPALVILSFLDVSFLSRTSPMTQGPKLQFT